MQCKMVHGCWELTRWVKKCRVSAAADCAWWTTGLTTRLSVAVAAFTAASWMLRPVALSEDAAGTSTLCLACQPMLSAVLRNL